MTIFNPPVSIPDARPSFARVNRLTPPRRVKSTGPLLALLQCIFTLGLLPLLLWPMRWADFAASERRDLLDIANWWRRRVSGSAGEQLDKIARGFRPRPMMMVLPWLIVGFNLLVMGAVLTKADSPDRLWSLTYGHVDRGSSQFVNERWSDGWGHYGIRRSIAPGVPLEAQLCGIWGCTLLAGYLFHLHAVRSHVANVRRLVKWTNGITRQSDIAPVTDGVFKWDMNPWWIIFCIGFCMSNAWWAIPMVLAGSMQRRYLSASSPAVRTALAMQAQAGARLVPVGDSNRVCPRIRCQTRLPALAKFCPRCGTAL